MVCGLNANPFRTILAQSGEAKTCALTDFKISAKLPEWPWCAWARIMYFKSSGRFPVNVLT